VQRTRHTSLTNLSVGHESWRDKGGNVIWSSFWKQWEEFIAPSRERARKRCELEKDCPFQLSAYNKMGKKADFNGYNAQIQTSYDLSNQQHQNITHTGNGVKRIRHNSQYLSNDHDCKIQQKATAVPAVCKMQSGKVLGKRKHAMTSNFVNIALLNYSLESEVKDDMLSQDSKPTTTYPVSTDKRSFLSTDIFRKNVKKSKFGSEGSSSSISRSSSSYSNSSSSSSRSSSSSSGCSGSRLAAQAESARRRSAAAQANYTKKGKPVYRTTHQVQEAALHKASKHLESVSDPKLQAKMKLEGKSDIHPEMWLEGTPPHIRKQQLRDEEVGRDPDAGFVIGSAEWSAHYIKTINTKGEPVPDWFKDIPPNMAPYVKTLKAMAQLVSQPAKTSRVVHDAVSKWNGGKGYWHLPAHANKNIVKLMVMVLNDKENKASADAILVTVDAELDQDRHVQVSARAAAQHLQAAGIELVPEVPELPANFVPPNAAELANLQVLCDCPLPNPLRVPVSTAEGKVDRDPWWESPCRTYYEAAAGSGSSGAVLNAAGLRCVGFSEIDSRKASIAARNLKCKVKHSGDFTKLDPNSIPDHDVLYGGLNCAPFSKIGLKLGLRDKRASVFWQFLVVAAIKQPKLCLIENVANFIASNKGRNFAIIKEIARMIGYQVSFNIRNACDFVRQDRSRCFIYLVRNDMAEAGGMPEPELPKADRQSIPQWLSHPDTVPHTWLDEDMHKYTEVRSPCSPVTDEEAGKPVVVGYIGEAMTVNSKVFINMVPAIKCNGGGHGGNTHLIRQKSKVAGNWISRRLDVQEVRRLHEPTTFKMRQLAYDRNDEFAIADIGASCPCDLLWPQAQAVVNFFQPVSKWRPHGTTFEKLGLPPDKLGRFRDLMTKGQADMERQRATGQSSTASNHRPDTNKWSRPLMQDEQGIFMQALPKGPAASKDPDRTKVTYCLEEAWRHNDPSLAYPIQQYYPPRSTFVPQFIANIAARGFADVNMKAMYVSGTDQANDTGQNQSFLPANAKSGQQYNFHINKPFEEDIVSGCAVAFGPHLCPPVWPIFCHKTGSCEKGDVKEADWIPGTDFKRRGNSDLGNKGVSDGIKARGIKAPNESVNLQLDMPTIHYITVRTIANSIILLMLCGVNPKMSAMDLARYYKQWFTRSSFYGTHCRYWPSAYGPAIIVSLSMLFGGKPCSVIAQRGSDMIAHFVQMFLDLIQPQDPKVRRWYDVQTWAQQRKDAGDVKYKDFQQFKHGAVILPYQDDFASNALPGFEMHTHCFFLAFLWESGLFPQCEKIFKDGNFDALKKILGVIFDLLKQGTVELSIPKDKIAKANAKIDKMISSSSGSYTGEQDMHISHAVSVQDKSVLTNVSHAGSVPHKSVLTNVSHAGSVPHKSVLTNISHAVSVPHKSVSVLATKVSLLEIQELHGLLNWFSLVIVKAGSHLSFLIMALRVAMKHGHAYICNDLVAQLKFWKTIIVDWNGRSVTVSPRWITEQQHIPSTDASRSMSDGGAGGVFKHWYFAFKWTVQEKEDLDIYHLEALACVLWLTWICKHHPDQVKGKRFRMWCDNEAWVYTIAKGRSSWPAMEFLGNYCHTLMAKHSFILQLDYLSTHKNIAADTASRFAWSAFFEHMRTSANMSQHEMLQVDLQAEAGHCALVLQTRRLRCLSLQLLTPLSATGNLSPSTGQSFA
jgi:DNA-cytosine methyltransferase